MRCGMHSRDGAWGPGGSERGQQYGAPEGIRGQRGRSLPAGRPPRYKARGSRLWNAVCRSRHLAFPSSSALFRFCCGHQPPSLLVLMASNYVDTAVEEGRFHGYSHGHSTTPTGAASSPKTMRRSWSSASSGHSHGHGAPKCVCAPATHAGSFKCRLHRNSSHGHGHPSSPPSPATTAGSSSSSRTVAA